MLLMKKIILETYLGSHSYFENKQYTEALSRIGTLLGELKRLDDKMLLMEVQLLESKVHHVLKSLPKARVSVISIRYSGEEHLFIS